MSNGILESWANSIHNLLQAGYEVASSATNHSLLLGDAREVMVRDILMRFLPASLVIGTGQIIDSNGHYSKQVDIIIYRSSFPIFRTLGFSDVYLLEGVVAAIEVKSTLGTKELEEALDNCASVKALSPGYVVHSAKQFCDICGLQYAVTDGPYPDIEGPCKERILEAVMPPTYIFGYKHYSSRLDDLEAALDAWRVSSQYSHRCFPDVIVTEGCVVVKNDKRPFRSCDDDSWIYLAKQDPAPIKYLLKHLLYRLKESVGLGMATHAGSGLILDSSLQTAIDTSGDWRAWWKREPKPAKES